MPDAELVWFLPSVHAALCALQAAGCGRSDDFANWVCRDRHRTRDARRNKKRIHANVFRASNANTNTAQRREHPRWACRILLRSD